MKALEVSGVSKTFPSGKVLEDISFTVGPGSIMAIAGESGCGKSTLLRIIAGFETPDSGTVSIGGDLMVGEGRYVAAEKRRTGFVFQDLALFPHLTIARNIGFGIAGSKRREEKVDELISMVGLQGLQKRYPHQVSGGQQQRVAIARALAIKPAVLLLDEPFSSLDQSLKTQVREEVLQIIRACGSAAVLVTHDIDDAYAMADHILVMQAGKILQSASPETVYTSPVNKYVAGFGGKINTLSEALLRVLGLPSDKPAGVRPGAVLIAGEGPGITGHIISRVFCGDHYEYRISTKAGELMSHAAAGYSPGSEVYVNFDLQKIIYFTS